MQIVGLVISWAVAIGIIGIGIGYAAKSEMNAAGFEAGKGHQRQGAHHVSDPQRRNRRSWHRYWQELIPRRWLDRRGAIMLRQKWSRGQVEARFANMPPSLIGMEACVGAHHLSRKLKELGHDARLMPGAVVLLRPTLSYGGTADLTVGSKPFHRLGGPQLSEREQGGRGGREPKHVVIGVSHNRSDRSRYSYTVEPETV